MQFKFEIKGTKFGMAVIGDLEVKESPKEFEKGEEKFFEAIRSKYSLKDLSGNKIIRSFRDFYWRFKMDPTKTRISSEALIRRILNGQSLRRINNVIDTVNLISAKSALPISALDLERIKPPITVRKAKNNEPFVRLGGKKIKCNGNEIIVADEEKILDYGFATADTELAKVTDKTKNVLILVYATEDIENDYLQETLDRTAELITKYAKGKIIEKEIK